jgi:hypothetical protein
MKIKIAFFISYFLSAVFFIFPTTVQAQSTSRVYAKDASGQCTLMWASECVAASGCVSFTTMAGCQNAADPVGYCLYTDGNGGGGCLHNTQKKCAEVGRKFFPTIGGCEVDAKLTWCSCKPIDVQGLQAVCVQQKLDLNGAWHACEGIYGNGFNCTKTSGETACKSGVEAANNASSQQSCFCIKKDKTSAVCVPNLSTSDCLGKPTTDAENYDSCEVASSKTECDSAVTAYKKTAPEANPGSCFCTYKVSENKSPVCTDVSPELCYANANYSTGYNVCVTYLNNNDCARAVKASSDKTIEMPTLPEQPKQTASQPKVKTYKTKGAFIPGCVDQQSGADYLSSECGSILIFLTLAFNIINYLFGIIGGVALLYFIYGGFILILSQGNGEKVEQGKAIIFAAVLGIAIAFGGYVLVKFAGSIAGITAEYRLD